MFLNKLFKSRVVTTLRLYTISGKSLFEGVFEFYNMYDIAYFKQEKVEVIKSIVNNIICSHGNLFTKH